jgi:hypothetical protein
VYSEVDATSYAFMASKAQSWVLQNGVLRDSGVCGMNLDLTMLWTVFVIQFRLLTLSILLIRTPSPLKPNTFWRMSFLVKLFRT